MKLFEDLKWRGLVDNITSPELEEKLNEDSITFYIGTDPSADSLHIGHFSSLLVAKRLKLGGHNPIILVGGATGLIGDPKPNTERPMIAKETLEYNYKKMSKQIDDLFGFDIVNNYDWSKDINFIDYLRDYGKFFPVPYMLAKDTVKSRLEVGITYTEFSYMIMQALDFLWLLENKNCTLQIGGSDQWGNITAGVELIRKKLGKDSYGMTMPLITKADGTKFGKSESGTVWLDKKKTSPYEMYQFLLNTEDVKVIEYLKKLTLLSKDEIEKEEISLKNEPHKRSAQNKLAETVVEFLHGSDELEKAKKIIECLFQNKINELSKDEILIGFSGVPSFEFNKNDSLLDTLVSSEIASSKREAREFIQNGSITVNGEKVTDLEAINNSLIIHGEIMIIRKGKKNYYIGKLI